MVALAIVVVVLLASAGSAALAERWARTAGLRRAQAQLRVELGTPAVDLSVPARPLSLALLGRSGSDATVTAYDVPVGDDARLRRLVIDLGGVRAGLRTGTLTTRGGSFHATIDEAELGRLVELPSVVSRLELRDDGLRAWTVLGVAIDVDVLVIEGGIRALPDPAQLAALLELPGLSRFRRTLTGSSGFRLAVPPLPLGAQVATIAFETGRAELTGHLPPATFILTVGPRRAAAERAPT